MIIITSVLDPKMPFGNSEASNAKAKMRRLKRNFEEK
jgi:hypothetical protein